MYFNNLEYILRKEFFGGLLIKKSNLTRYEINKYDYLFLKLFSQGNYNLDDTIHYINEQLEVEYVPDIRLFENLNILISDDSKLDSDFCPIDSYQENKNYLSYPIELSIYPSLKCNLNCTFCFLGTKLNQKYTEKTAIEWFKLIKEAMTNGCLSVSILGGEPLLYFDILNLVKLLEKEKIRTSITSNGLCWKKPMLDFIKKSQYVTPIFSIQSFRTFNKRVMGRNHNIDKWKKNVQEISKEKKIRINSVYLGQDVQELEEIIDFCYKNNVEKYSLAYKYDTNADWNSFKEIIKVQDYLEKYIQVKGYESLYFSVEGCMIYSAYEDLDGSVVSTPYQQLTYGCEAGNSRMEIVPNGDSYPCISFFEKDLTCGNVFNSSISDVWNNSVLLNRIRSGKTDDDKCLSCSLNHFCNGGCPMVNLDRNGSMFGEGDPRCLIKEKMG